MKYQTSMSAKSTKWIILFTTWYITTWIHVYASQYRSIEHQQECIRGNWSCSGAIEHTKEYHDHFDPWKIGTMRESLKIDMVVVRYGEDKVWTETMEIFVKTNAWKPLFKKIKTLHWNLTSFYIKWRFCVELFDQFEKGFNQCGQNILLWII